MPGGLRRRLVALTIGALAVTAFVPAVAQAAQPNTNSPSTIDAMRAQLRAGTLLQSTKVIDFCAQVHAACDLKGLAAGGSSKPLSTTEPIGYGAADLANAYHLPAAGVGANGTIAILDAGAYPNLESDLNTYRAEYGLPACTTASGCLKIADYKGGAPLTPDPSDLGKAEEEDVAVETSLDVDMASAACPECHIIELQLPDADGFPSSQADEDVAIGDFGTAVKTAVAMGANAVSMSYQYDPDAYSDTGQPARDLYQPGVAVLASSGDGGFEFNLSGWPQDLPSVVSVGGTSLLASGSKYTQVAWDGAGSSCATDEPPAIGQPKSVSKACGGHRAASDISAVADPTTGVATYDTYAPASGEPQQWGVWGGTSASSPFVAALYARGGHLSQVLGPNTLYSAKKGTFTDVTLGQNAPNGSCQSLSYGTSVCQAGKGWDGPTGVGTPHGLAGF
ncbi:MAG TPA: peptidase S8 [Pseudonocardiaceae bacterium]|nr:peptidase S8 [Pseudonocardiaceae bacterium]